jgi:hypothetical protein
VCDNWLCYSSVVDECARRLAGSARHCTTAAPPPSTSKSPSDHVKTDIVAPLQIHASKQPASAALLDPNQYIESADCSNNCPTNDTGQSIGVDLTSMATNRSRGRQLKDLLGFRKHSSTPAPTVDLASTAKQSPTVKKRNGLSANRVGQGDRSEQEQRTTEIRPASELPTRKYSYNNGRLTTSSLNKNDSAHISTSGLSLVAVTADWFGDLLRRRRKSAEPTANCDESVRSKERGSLPSNVTIKHECEYCHCHTLSTTTAVRTEVDQADEDIEKVHKYLVEKSSQTGVNEQIDCSIDCTDAAFNLNRLSIEVDSRKQSYSSADSSSIVSMVPADEYAHIDTADKPKWACRLSDPIGAIFGPEPSSVGGPMDTSQWVEVGKQMVEYIANYIQTIDQRRVTPNIEPGESLRLRSFKSLATDL